MDHRQVVQEDSLLTSKINTKNDHQKTVTNEIITKKLSAKSSPGGARSRNAGLQRAVKVEAMETQPGTIALHRCNQSQPHRTPV